MTEKFQLALFIFALALAAGGVLVWGERWVLKNRLADTEEALQRWRLAQRVPPGCVVVPVEPTEAMLEAAHNSDREYTLRNFGDIMTVMQGPYDHWCSMIAAAPQAKEQTA